MNQPIPVVLLIIALIMICICGAPASVPVPSQNYAPYKENSMTTTSEIDISGGFVLIVCAVLVIAIAIYQIFKNGYGTILVFFVLGIALIAGLFWVLLFRGGDVSTADARDENLQIVKVVQPVGNDLEADAGYAEVNQDNAKANVTNAGSTAIYIALAWITILVFGVIGVFLWFMTHK